MKSWPLTILCAAALAGCMSIPGAPKAPETIRYVTGPCKGTCPVYVVTVSSDGVAMYDGRQNVLVTGRRTFVVSDNEYQAFKAALAPWRPQGTRELRGAACTTQATDLPSVEVAWRDEERSDILHADFGCDREANQALFSALANAPRTLPLGPFVGRR